MKTTLLLCLFFTVYYVNTSVLVPLSLGSYQPNIKCTIAQPTYGEASGYRRAELANDIAEYGDPNPCPHGYRRHDGRCDFEDLTAFRNLRLPPSIKEALRI